MGARPHELPADEIPVGAQFFETGAEPDAADVRLTKIMRRGGTEPQTLEDTAR